MRSHGLVDSPRDLGVDGHGCWGFDDVDELAAPAATFLVDGLALGQKLMFVGGAASEAMIRSTEPMASMVADGSLHIVPFDSVYPRGRRRSNADQWATYRAATEAAVADGYAGLRVLAEVTSLAIGDGSPGVWREQAAWEAFADAAMAGGRLSALCCFDRGALSDEALGGIACVHPVVDKRLRFVAPFRLHATSDAHVLTGEVDTFSAGILDEVLALVPGDDVVIDLGGLSFIDHNGVRVIERHARRLRESGARLTLEREPDLFRRLSSILN